MVKRIHDRDSIDGRFYEKHYTKVDSKHFDPIVEGMYRAVNVDGDRPAWPVSKESTFAARPVPRRIRMARTTVLSCVSLRATIRKIAVSVYVENGRWGGIAAAPIASLLTELYLTDTVTRPQLVEYVKNLQINYPYYGK